jgi:bacterial/archaeal transporter family-2 protein
MNRSTQQARRESVAGFGYLVRADHVLFRRASLIHPHPLPTQKDLAELPWWAVVGGLVGAVQVYACLTLVNKVGAGPFVGFTVTAALITSLLIDHFGWFRMQPHPLNVGRAIGGVLLVGGISLITKF